MDISGEFEIPASRQQVWEALNDPDVLAQCIPGCESIERESDTELHAKMRAKVGPVKARFESRIMLSNLNPPQSYTISGEGKGGPAGFGKGSADVSLAEADGSTTLRYTATLQVGGKLAQVGSRLVGGAARKIADDFFAKFAEVVAQPVGSD
jgi:carbon monoxide dehydrogenase subunit G